LAQPPNARFNSSTSFVVSCGSLTFIIASWSASPKWARLRSACKSLSLSESRDIPHGRDCRAPMIVRRATAEDALDVLAWRNDPLARAMSRTQDLVEEAGHVAWFSKAINDPRRTVLIGEVDDQKIGMVRFDHGDGTEVSININPPFRGRGLGYQLLSDALAYVSGPIIAEIKEENLASLRLFERAGFVFERTADGLRRYLRA